MVNLQQPNTFWQERLRHMNGHLTLEDANEGLSRVWGTKWRVQWDRWPLPMCMRWGIGRGERMWSQGNVESQPRWMSPPWGLCLGVLGLRGAGSLRLLKPSSDPAS